MEQIVQRLYERSAIFAPIDSLAFSMVIPVRISHP
jgi:hypothetical protein